MTDLIIRTKRETSMSAQWAPVFGEFNNSFFMSWVNRNTSQLKITRTADFKHFDQEVKIERASQIRHALVGGKAGLLMAWVDRRSKQICTAESTDGIEWLSNVRLQSKTNLAPCLAYHDDKYWLLWQDLENQRIQLMQKTEGRPWRKVRISEATTNKAPKILPFRERLLIIWTDAGSGDLYLSDLSKKMRNPEVIHRAPPDEYDLGIVDDQLCMTWFDQDKNQIQISEMALGQTRIENVFLKKLFWFILKWFAPKKTTEWKNRTVIHERSDHSPSLFTVSDKLLLSWVRDDAGKNLHFAFEQTDDSKTNRFIFTGDVQGHPTAVDPEHKTPYPYLGIVVLPSDWNLPQGNSAAALISDLDTKLNEVREFWAEASYDKVDITYEVHPQVINLPKTMNEYMIRKRPKLIDGFGAVFPVTFLGGETLEIEGTGNFNVTVTFTSGSKSRNVILDEINAAITAAAFSGPSEEEPIAKKSDIDQVRIQTKGAVDPNTVLEIAGGTAINMLGLDANSRTVYEGSKTQTDHLGIMLRDALKAVGDTKQDPSAYLSQFYGATIVLASNLGWYAIRANASMGPDQFTVYDSSPPFKMAFYYITSLDNSDVYGHETGHNLSLPDLYEEGWRINGSEVGNWDMMSNNLFSHPTSWMKSYRSNTITPSSRWMEGNNLALLDSVNNSLEVILIPSESPFPNTNPFAQSHPGIPVCHAIKIALESNHSFYVENRQSGAYSHSSLGDIDHSLHLPGDGIIITDAVDDVTSTQLPRAHVVLAQPRGLQLANLPNSIIDQVLLATSAADKQLILDPYILSGDITQNLANNIIAKTDREGIELAIRLYQEGQVYGFYPVDTVGQEVDLYQFPDGNGNIRVKINEVIGSQKPFVYRVQADWGRAGSWFDFEINKWKNPPPYESHDIWVDSEENGWDVYEHNDAALNPSVAGNPILNGDRPWVNKVNRVYARVWNHGDIPQNNVRVDFEVIVPPGQSSGYAFATDYIDIPAGGSAIAMGLWTPINISTEDHSCISVNVEYRPWDIAASVIGELNSINNSAQENINDFYLQSASPYEEIRIPYEFANPWKDPVEMKFRAHGLKPGWTLEVTPYQVFLDPSERVEGEAILRAKESVPLEDTDEGFPAPVISLEALVRTSCTWEPVGGFSMIGHTVRKAKLEVGIDRSGAGVHVTAIANTQDGPINQGNIAARMIGPSKETIALVRGTTDSQGRADLFVPVTWSNYDPGSEMTIETRLWPAKKAGPAVELTPVPL